MKVFVPYILVAITGVFASQDLSGNATLTHDQVYDNPKGSLLGVACSNGPHGMIPKGELQSLRVILSRDEGFIVHVYRLSNIRSAARFPKYRCRIRRRKVGLCELWNLLESCLRRHRQKHKCASCGFLGSWHFQHCPCCHEQAHE